MEDVLSWLREQGERYSRKAPEMALSFYQEMAEKARGNSRVLEEAHFRMAQILFDLQDLPRSNRHLLEVLKHNPRRALYHSLLGANFLAQQRGREARESFLQALKLDPENGESLNGLGTAHLLEGEVQEAESCFRECLKKQPGNPGLWQNLGFCLLVQERFEEAVEIFQRAVALAPQDAALQESLYNALEARDLKGRESARGEEMEEGENQR